MTARRTTDHYRALLYDSEDRWRVEDSRANRGQPSTLFQQGVTEQLAALAVGNQLMEDSRANRGQLNTLFQKGKTQQLAALMQTSAVVSQLLEDSMALSEASKSGLEAVEKQVKVLPGCVKGPSKPGIFLNFMEEQRIKMLNSGPFNPLLKQRKQSACGMSSRRRARNINPVLYLPFKAWAIRWWLKAVPQKWTHKLLLPLSFSLSLLIVSSRSLSLPFSPNLFFPF